MKQYRKPRISQRTTKAHAALAALCMLVACGDNLIQDPSFDLWCGDKLCKPWEAKGSVKRVGTWHKADYGVSLGDGASLTQLSTHDPVKCIELSVIADVDARAGVQVEMDFQDDGTSEYHELVPESHWAMLRYVVKAPSWYEKVRFVIRKSGKGRAVVAQVKAESTDDCKGSPAIELLHRPDGAPCDDADQCDSAQCEEAPLHYGLPTTLAEAAGKDMKKNVCSSCGGEAACGAGELCDVLADEVDGHQACVKKGESPLGAWCIQDAACASGHCLAPVPVEHATCGECASDADCKSGEICGVDVTPEGAARACHAKQARGLGDMCGSKDDCASGVCCGGACSECCGEAIPCSGKQVCKAHEVWLTVQPTLCSPGVGLREVGEDCADDSDCASGDCKLAKPVCLVRCEGGDCGEKADLDCGFLRQLAGVCR